MIVYAESSAVLAWIFREPGTDAVRLTLAEATMVVTSRLTVVECARAIDRAGRERRIPAEAALAAHRLLDEAADTWVVMDLVGDLVHRAARPFPKEPLRTLDAFHLASALIFDQALGSLRVLTRDDRVRENAAALGLAVA